MLIVMNIQIKTTNIELTSAISEYVHKKFESLSKLLKGEPESILCYVDIGRTTRHHKQGDIFRADVNMTVKGKHIYASSEKTDLYTAIDDVKKEVMSELKTVKEKKKMNARREGTLIKSLVRGIHA